MPPNPHITTCLGRVEDDATDGHRATKHDGPTTSDDRQTDRRTADRITTRPAVTSEPSGYTLTVHSLRFTVYNVRRWLGFVMVRTLDSRSDR